MTKNGSIARIFIPSAATTPKSTGYTPTPQQDAPDAGGNQDISVAPQKKPPFFPGLARESLRTYTGRTRPR
jgi:hypothetical protein